MLMAFVFLITGLICVVYRRVSHLRDKEYMAVYQEQIYAQRQVGSNFFAHSIDQFRLH